MITLEDYFEKMSRVEGETPPQSVRDNAAALLDKVNKLLDAVFNDTQIEAARKRQVRSGWRTSKYNSSVPNAAKKSKHMIGAAVDVSDPECELATFLNTKEGRKLLVEYGLYMEAPFATVTWCHLQDIPPGSGNRVFIP